MLNSLNILYYYYYYYYYSLSLICRVFTIMYLNKQCV
jgi:hypothetical protein